jgi:hypothetical protein
VRALRGRVRFLVGQGRFSPAVTFTVRHFDEPKENCVYRARLNNGSVAEGHNTNMMQMIAPVSVPIRQRRIPYKNRTIQRSD